MSNLRASNEFNGVWVVGYIDNPLFPLPPPKAEYQVEKTDYQYLWLDWELNLPVLLTDFSYSKATTQYKFKL